MLTIGQEQLEQFLRSPQKELSINATHHFGKALCIQDIMPHTTKPVIAVMSDQEAYEQLLYDYQFIDPDFSIIEFPEWDCMAYDKISPERAIIAKRIACLYYLATLQTTSTQSQKTLVVTTVKAIMQKLPPQDIIKKQSCLLQKNQHISMDELIYLLIDNGYQRVDIVREEGYFAVRGGIIDVMPTGAPNPIRIDFFGDSIEALSYFDSVTQKRLKQQETLEYYKLIGHGEIIVNAQTKELFKQEYCKIFGANALKDDLWLQLNADLEASGMEHYLPLFYKQCDSFFDYCYQSSSCAYFLLDFLWEASLTKHQEHIQHYYKMRQDYLTQNPKALSPMRPLPPEYLYLKHDHIISYLTSQKKLIIQQHNHTQYHADYSSHFYDYAPTITSHAQPYQYLLSSILSEYPQHHILCAVNKSHITQLTSLLQENNIAYTHVHQWSDINFQQKISLASISIQDSFFSDTWALWSEKDLFHHETLYTKPPQPIKKISQKDKQRIISEVSSLKEGDYLVHIDHGIGQYQGLKNIQVNNVSHDCVKIIYADNDTLFVPVENIDMLSRYGNDDYVVCDKLGHNIWQQRKEKAQKRIKDMADALIKQEALRSMVHHDASKIEQNDDYVQFCSYFPFQETDDQLKAIYDIIQDLQGDKLMDRLICGDVGFGKTEVAMRASYLMVQQKKQIALICPTTLLARQHYHNFIERFQHFPINIGLLSRMVTPKQKNKVKEDLKNGTIDIVIGTHALLSSTIKFKDLALAIIDEEQHFGVKQKENIKKIGEQIHILTLSATPIPRTLQMAMSGLRSLSLMTTPPSNRLAIKTFASVFDPIILKEAILREIHRGGQLFIVCPRIRMLDKAFDDITQLLPNMKIVKAHGQLPHQELDYIMTEFATKKADILLATNIIESGIDMPNVNSMIIFHADLFGLSQLYQLRGRVGRGKLRGYCYLTWPQYRPISPLAKKKLEVLSHLDYLGAGFNLASHDMDLRGAGNMLGEEQSGHIKDIGIELYQKLLADTITRLKFEQVHETIDQHHHHEHIIEHDDYSPQIFIDVPVFIPDDYIADYDLKMSLYQRLSQCKEDIDITDFADELKDRFGDYPKSIENLLHISTIKIYCKKAGIAKFQTGSKGAIIHFKNNVFENPQGLISYIQQQQGKAQIRPDQSIILIRQWAHIDKRMQDAKNIAKKIAFIRKNLL